MTDKNDPYEFSLVHTDDDCVQMLKTALVDYEAATLQPFFKYYSHARIQKMGVSGVCLLAAIVYESKRPFPAF